MALTVIPQNSGVLVNIDGYEFTFSEETHTLTDVGGGNVRITRTSDDLQVISTIAISEFRDTANAVVAADFAALQTFMNTSLSDNTAGTFTGATSSTVGTAGGVPAPAAGSQNAVLLGGGTWSKPSNSTALFTGSGWAERIRYSSTNLDFVSGQDVRMGQNSALYFFPASSSSITGLSQLTISASGSTGTISADNLSISTTSGTSMTGGLKVSGSLSLSGYPDPYRLIGNISGPHLANSLTYSLVSESNFYCRGSVNVASDRRIKEDIEELNTKDCLDKVKALRSTSYLKNVDGSKYPELGWIAQEVGEAGIGEAVHMAPDLLGEGEHGLSLEHGALLAVLWAAVRGLSKEVDELKAKLN